MEIKLNVTEESGWLLIEPEQRVIGNAGERGNTTFRLTYPKRFSGLMCAVEIASTNHVESLFVKGNSFTLPDGFGSGTVEMQMLFMREDPESLTLYGSVPVSLIARTNTCRLTMRP